MSFRTQFVNKNQISKTILNSRYLTLKTCELHIKHLYSVGATNNAANQKEHNLLNDFKRTINFLLQNGSIER